VPARCCKFPLLLPTLELSSPTIAIFNIYKSYSRLDLCLRKCAEWNRKNREYFKGNYLKKKILAAEEKNRKRIPEEDKIARAHFRLGCKKTQGEFECFIRLFNYNGIFISNYSYCIYSPIINKEVGLIEH
jgi:hypothetical protein